MTNPTEVPGATGPVQDDPPANPYPGLRAFDADEVDLFFGRESQVNELLKRLKGSRFLALLGPSGSGKSSVVKAGLLPALQRGFITGAGSTWRIASLRPEGDPIGNLARALNGPGIFGADGDDEEIAEMQTLLLETTIRGGLTGLVDACREARLPKNENLLVLVDQFEELFRYRQDATKGITNDPAFFSQLLIRATAEVDASIYVVLTMRSDFLGDCTLIPGLAEAINDGMYLIPRLTREERRLAIEGPAGVRGRKMAQPLVIRLLNDAGDSPDRLPVLQHAMMRTWEEWQAQGGSGDLELHHYENIGGMALALSRHADEAFGDLPDARSQAIAEVMFKCLTFKETDGRGVRRPTPVGEIARVAEVDPADVIRVAEPFRLRSRSFLFPPLLPKDPKTRPLTADSVLDISHESLMRVWTRLIEWVDDETEARQSYLELAELAAGEQAGQKGLLEDPELELFLNWQVRQNPTEAWAIQYDPSFDRAILYLKRSADKREKDRWQVEADRQKKLKRLGYTIAAMTVFLFAFAGVIAWGFANEQDAISQRRVAAAAQDSADVARQRARAESLMAAAARDSAGMARASAEVARQRARQDSILAVQTTRRAAAVAAAARDSAEVARDSAEVARQRAVLASIQAARAETEATAARARKDSLATLALARKLALQASNEGDVHLQRLLALQAYVYHMDKGGSLQDPDIYRALQRSIRDGLGELPSRHEDQVRAAAFGPDGSLASVDVAGRLCVWSEPSGARPEVRCTTRALGQALRTVALSPSLGLAAGTQGGRVLLWPDPSDLSNVITLDGAAPCPDDLRCTSGIRALAFVAEAGGESLLAAGQDGSLRRWTLAGPDPGPVTPVADSRPPGSPRVNAAAFGPELREVVLGGDDGTVERRTLGSGRSSPGSRVALPAAATAAAYRPDGGAYAVGLADGRIVLCDACRDAPSGRFLVGHTAGVTALAFHPTDPLLISGSLDGTVRIWNTLEPGNPSVVLEGHLGWVWSVDVSGDGVWIASASADLNVRLWLVHTEDLAREVFCRAEGAQGVALSEWRDFIGAEPADDKPVAPDGGVLDYLREGLGLPASGCSDLTTDRDVR